MWLQLMKHHIDAVSTGNIIRYVIRAMRSSNMHITRTVWTEMVHFLWDIVQAITAAPWQ